MDFGNADVVRTTFSSYDGISHLKAQKLGSIHFVIKGILTD